MLLKPFCTHFPYRSPLLCHPLVKDFPLVKLWTSETGGVVICLASTLMVLDHFCGKFPTPTRWWYWPRPTGRTITSDFVISKSHIFCNKDIALYTILYSVITQQGRTRDITDWCQTKLILFYPYLVPKYWAHAYIREFLEKITRESRVLQIIKKKTREIIGNSRRRLGDFEGQRPKSKFFLNIQKLQLRVLQL